MFIADISYRTLKVARAPEVLKGISEGELKGTEVIPDAVQPGAFDEQMKGIKQGGRVGTN